MERRSSQIAKALSEEGKDGRAIAGGRRYATSKLCTMLYAYEIDRRLRRAGTPMASIAYDPGFLPETGMGRTAPAIFRNSAVKFVLKTIGVTIGQMPFSGDALGVLAAQLSQTTLEDTFLRKGASDNLYEVKSRTASLYRLR